MSANNGGALHQAPDSAQAILFRPELFRIADANSSLSNFDCTVAWLAKIEGVAGATAASPARSSWAEYSRAWRDRQPKRGRRSNWIWGHPTYTRRISPRHCRAILDRAHKFNRAHRRPGHPYGPFGAKGVDVLAAVLIIQHREFGRCCPSHDDIAKKAKCSTNTVYRALNALQLAGFLAIVPRREIGRRRDGRVAPMVRSNGYLFPAADGAQSGPDRDNRGANRSQFFRTSVQAPEPTKQAASAWSADLRPPAAAALSRIYLPPDFEVPF